MDPQDIPCIRNAVAYGWFGLSFLYFTLLYLVMHSQNIVNLHLECCLELTLKCVGLSLSFTWSRRSLARRLSTLRIIAADPRDGHAVPEL